MHEVDIQKKADEQRLHDIRQLNMKKLKKETVSRKKRSAAYGSGPKIIFVDLRGEEAGYDWSTGDAVGTLAAQWKELLATGGNKVTLFHAPDELTKIIVNVDHGHQVEEVKDFFVRRPETLKVSWDKNKFWGEYVEDDEL